MPPRRQRRRKNTKKPKQMRSKTTNVNRALTPFAQRYITKMKYSGVFTLSGANSFNYRYRLNSIFDPDESGVGVQPYGHDTCQTIYNRYRVVGCSYTISFFSASSAVRVVALPANDTVTVTSLSDAIMNPRAKWKIQYPGGSAAQIKGSVSIPSLMGRNKNQYMADDRFQAQFGNNPAELAILNIFGGDLADSGATIQGVITLNYLVECFDVKNLPGS